MKSEDVVCGLEFGDGYEADLGCVSLCRMCVMPRILLTFRLLFLVAFMRDVMLVRFSVSCLARWAFICISSAMSRCCGSVAWVLKVEDIRAAIAA